MEKVAGFGNDLVFLFFRVTGSTFELGYASATGYASVVKPGAALSENTTHEFFRRVLECECVPLGNDWVLFQFFWVGFFIGSGDDVVEELLSGWVAFGFNGVFE